MSDVLNDLKAIDTGLTLPNFPKLSLIETEVEELKDQRISLSRVYILRGQLGVQFAANEREYPLALERAESYMRHLIYSEVENHVQGIFHKAYSGDIQGVIDEANRLRNFIRGKHDN